MANNSKCRIPKTATVRINRGGILTTALLVAAVTLLSVMTFFTTCTFQIRLVWKDIRNQRIAMEELNNQLESITLLHEMEASKTLETLVPSTICKKSLQNPKLTGSLKKDLLGSRVTLQLDWDKRHSGKPMEVSGWLQNKPQKENPSSQSETSSSSSNSQWITAASQYSKINSSGLEVRE